MARFRFVPSRRRSSGVGDCGGVEVGEAGSDRVVPQPGKAGIGVAGKANWAAPALLGQSRGRRGGRDRALVVGLGVEVGSLSRGLLAGLGREGDWWTRWC